ncbi:hypothetical protein ACPF7Z_10515 [Halomonas sp. GXIMD04776]|uniref:hypothetical protein n=1 Tax=Halomonas sp. GXIMD04776 TaxID=3415605 RepID=UPI003CAB4CF8
MHESTGNSSDKLTVEAAQNLWLRTLNRAEDEPHYWNEWVKENPVCSVTFSDVDFNALRDEMPDRKVSFAGFKFPHGRVSFVRTNFGSEGVSFVRTDFGDGDVDFFDAVFEQGNIHFMEAEFGEGDVKFTGAKFGDGEISFKNAKFGKGKVSFKHVEPFNKCRTGDVIFDEVEFGEGDVYFFKASFGVGFVSFCDAVFGTGAVDFESTDFGMGAVVFSNTQFGDGDVSFKRAKFRNGREKKEDKEKKGHVIFSGAVFGEGNVVFDNAFIGFCPATSRLGKIEPRKEKIDYMNVIFERTNFGAGEVSFNRTGFGNGKISFEDAVFGAGRVSFAGAEFGVGHIEFLRTQVAADFRFLPTRLPGPGPLDFRYCTFSSRFELTRNDQGSAWEKPLSFEGALFNSAVEIRNVRFVDVPDFRSTAFTFYFSLENIDYINDYHNSNNAIKLRRLKDLAEKDGDHYLALRFHADELRTRRWKQTSKFESVLDFLYDFLCGYGQTILRPTLCLFANTIVFSIIYFFISSKPLFETGLFGYLLFSFTTSLPFLAISRDFRLYSINNLFNECDVSAGLYALLSAQGLISAILLFLIGLGLRNHFRI